MNAWELAVEIKSSFDKVLKYETKTKLPENKVIEKGHIGHNQDQSKNKTWAEKQARADKTAASKRSWDQKVWVWGEPFPD